MGIETGVRPGGRGPALRVPSSGVRAGERRIESRFAAALPLSSVGFGEKLGIANWLMDG